jgi:tRNA-specific adenosine deaminase 3
VTYCVDVTTDSIRFTTTRLVNPGEELCIFYGHDLWFEPVISAVNLPEKTREMSESIKPFGADIAQERHGHFLDSDLDEMIPEDELPFSRISLTPDHEVEEELNAIRTGMCFSIFSNTVIDSI